MAQISNSFCVFFSANMSDMTVMLVLKWGLMVVVMKLENLPREYYPLRFLR